MRRLLSWLIGLPVALVIAVFAAANRQSVTLDVWPLPLAVEVPLYLLVLLPLLVGFLVGLLLSSLRGLSRRTALRRKVGTLEREIARRDRLAQAGAQADALAIPSAGLKSPAPSATSSSSPTSKGPAAEDETLGLPDIL